MMKGVRFKWFSNFFAEHSIKKNFINLIKQTNPDLIITVYPGFVGSVNNILEKTT
jgi:hypothetical protein